MKEEHVIRTDRKLVYKGSILDIYSDTMKLPDGGTETWDFVHHRKGAAAVVAALPDRRLILVHQYRPALDRWTWELPAGARDSVDEETIVCARRELKEETGYVSQSWRKLLSLKTTVAFCDEFVDVFLAEDIEKVSQQNLDPSEVIDIRAFEVDELVDKIFEGSIQDSKTVSGILAYKALL